MAAGAVGAAVLLSPAAANAANFQVDKTTDGAPGGACDAAAVNDCSLRDAITKANANADADVITFGVTGEITLSAGQLPITNELTIQGPGASNLTVSGDGHSRVFRVTGSAPVTISGLTMADGDGSSDPGDAGGADDPSEGGAIANSAPLTLVDSTVTGSSGTSGGGIASGDNSAADLTLQNTRVTDNESNTEGGGIFMQSPLHLTSSVVSGNIANDGNGGGIYQDKYDLTLTDTTVSHNSAVDGGGIGSYGGSQQDNSGHKYDLTVIRSTISDNDANDESGTGGGIDFEHTITSTASVSNSTIANNSAAIGGGIHAGFEEQVVEAASNRAENQSGSLTVDNTTIASNDASDTGGGIGLEDEVTDGDDPSISSTIVGDNTATSANKDISTTSQGINAGFSLIQVPNAGVTTDPAKPTITGQDPQLAGLTGNGGPTETKLPAGSSPAIDKGTANGLTIEQRHTARTLDLAPANASDGTDIGAVEIPVPPAATPPSPLKPSSTPAICGRRAISLVRADVKGSKVKLSGLVGSKLYGKQVTIQTDPKGARNSAFTKTLAVTASKTTGKFTATVPKPDKEDFVSVRYRAKSGGSTSPALKLPQSLTSRSVKSAKGTITVKGKVKTSVLGKRNRVKIRRLVCGRYRTVGTAKPDADGRYSVTFKATAIRGVSFYRAESKVLRKPGSKHYVIQYARAIAIRTTSQTG